MTLLDTNVFYRLTDLENDGNLNINKLKDFVSHNSCYCSIYTYFEILNSKFTLEDKTRVLDYIRYQQIFVEGVGYIKQKQNANLCQNLKLEFGSIIINKLFEVIYFFVKSYIYSVITINIDHLEKEVSKEKKYFRKYFEIYQKDIDRHIVQVLKHNLNYLLSIDSFNAESIQNMLLRLIANLMQYYDQFKNYAGSLFIAHGNCSYYEMKKGFKKLKSSIMSDMLDKDIEYDYRKFSICNILIDIFKEQNNTEISLNNYKQGLVHVLMGTINWKKGCNDFEKKWLERNIESLFTEKSKIKFNDFMDYGIMQELYYLDNLDRIITFDNKIKNIMKDLPQNNKFANSIDLIESFKIKK